jgi:hypothetical protein
MHYGTASKLTNSYCNYLTSDTVSFPKILEPALTLLMQQQTYLARINAISQGTAMEHQILEMFVTTAMYLKTYSFITQ